MRLLATGFFLGILLLQPFKVLPPMGWALALLVSVPAMFLFWRKRLVFALLLGFAYAIMMANLHVRQQLPALYYGKDLIVSGQISSIPDKRERGWRFRFDVDQAVSADGGDSLQDFTGSIRLALYEGKLTPVAGEYWQFKVRLKPPQGFVNPGGFDYEKWLFGQRIRATGYVRYGSENQRLKPAPGWYIHRIRSHIHEQITERVAQPELAAIISALAVAERQGISDQQWETFRHTGTSHLIAISGLHIGMVAGFGYLLVWPLWWLFPKLYLRMPVQLAGAWAGGILATVYALLAGMTLPTQRALIMVLVVLMALVAKRRYAKSTVFAVALLLVLLLDPLAVLSAGFWLSFLAVGLIFYVLETGKAEGWKAVVSIQLLLSVAMMPVTMALFGNGSLSSPLANLIAIPWVTLAVVPLILLALPLLWLYPPLGEGLLNLAAMSVNALTAFLGWLGHLLPGLNLPEAPLWVTIAAVAGVVWLWFPRAWWIRGLGVMLILPWLLWKPDGVVPGAFRFYALDVGQGTATVVQTRNHVLVYDVGAKAGGGFDIGELVMLPFLRSQGLKRVDELMISHEDIDHRGGLGAVLSAIPVKRVLSSDPGIAKNVAPCKAGQHWQWDGVDFTVLWPDQQAWRQQLSDNNMSCVLLVSNGHHRLLLTGDIEVLAEHRLLENYPGLEVDVLTVPHHGSKTSSSEVFLDQLKPDLALNSAGFMNRFHHPHATVRQRYAQRGIRFLSNVESGAIRVDFPAQPGLSREITAYREHQQRYWHRQPEVENRP